MKLKITILTSLFLIFFSCSMGNESGVLLPTELSQDELAKISSNSDSNSSSSNTETATGEELGRTIYLPVMDIYVARGARNDDNPHGTDVSEENIRKILCGWGMNSINPILLQMDIAILEENITIHNVILEPDPNNKITDPDREDYGKTFFGWKPFANSSFRGFGGNYGNARMILPECDINGNPTGRQLDVDPVTHHVLFLEWGPTGGYTGYIKSGIVNDVSGATRNVIAHEFGHMFGLGHYSPPEGEAWAPRLMSPTIYSDDLYLSNQEKQIVKNYIQRNYIAPSGYNPDIHRKMKSRIKTTSVETGSLTKQNMQSAEGLLNFRLYGSGRSDLALTEM